MNIKTELTNRVNPFTTKCGQRQISTKFANFIFQNFDKQIASCESTGRELLVEWSHHRISSIDSKVRVILQNSIKHSGSERVNIIVCLETPALIMIATFTAGQAMKTNINSKVTIFFLNNWGVRIERFSLDCRKTKTKVNTLANQSA